MIARRSKKRAKDERHYAVQAKEFFQNAVINKTNRCFFCGEYVDHFQGLHHLSGRREGSLLDFNLIVIVHNECHLFYHSATVQQMQQKKWYNEWMNRLRLKDDTAYRKEINKSQKGILFEE
jgi:hypothetical protein